MRGRRAIATSTRETLPVGLEPQSSRRDAARAGAGEHDGSPLRTRLGLALGPALTVAVAAVVVGLALDGGAYPLTSRNAAGVLVWWALALGVALSVWPLARAPRGALFAVGLLALFALFTGLSIAWTESAEKAFAEMDRVLLYVGVLALAVMTSTSANAGRWRDGLALGIVSVGLIALGSRLFGDQVGSRDLLELLPGVRERLSHPIDYWNGLAMLVALGFPLLLGAATARRPAPLSALALAPLPALVAVIYLTSSRGGAATAIVGSVLFCALTSRRLAALGALLCAGAGSAMTIAILQARPELVDGPLGSAAATSQGESAALLIALACAVAGGAYWLGGRFVPVPRLRPGRAAGALIALAGVLLVAGALVAADPAERFETFKKPPEATAAGEPGFTQSHLLSGGGSGRWQFWNAAVDEFETRPATGRGAGSYEAWWTEHGSLTYFVRDAHSLYLETLAELGVIGLGLLLAALGCGVVVAGTRLRAARSDETRVLIASLAAAFVGFAVAAGIDWIWELTVVAIVGIALLGLLVGPATAAGVTAAAARAPAAGARRVAFAAASLVVIVALAIPLLSQTKIVESQEAVAHGAGREALDDALAARRLQGWAASPHLQLALVEEQTGHLGAARRSIAEAIERDRSDWRLWLVSARLETKAGRIGAARRSLREAERLNPRSPLFPPR